MLCLVSPTQLQRYEFDCSAADDDPCAVALRVDGCFSGAAVELDSFAALGSLDSPGIGFGLGYGRSRLGIANRYFSNLHQPNG